MSDQALPSGPSPVARGRVHMPGLWRMMGAAGCAAAVAGALAWVVWPRPPREAPSTNTRANWTANLDLPESAQRRAPLPVVAPVPPPSAAAFSPPPPADVLSPVVAPPKVAAMAIWEDAAAIQQAQQVQQQALAARQAAAQATASAGNQPANDPNVATPGSEYAQRMQATRFANATPIPPRFHVQYTIKKGTTFPCTPSQPISSALPGPVQCVVDQHVWSMDGTTILLPRGTQVNGSIERGLSNGEQRLFLVWTDALTPRPDLLAIPLDAPAADEMGQTGVPGDVNNHLWARVKAALLLSLVDIGGNVATGLAQRGNGNTNINLGGLTGQTQTLGQAAFARDLNIPPTLNRGPGQPLTVYVNKYIDLVNYYQNKARY